MSVSSINRQQLLEQLLAPHGQQHLLRFWHELSPSQQDDLAAQISNVDWDEIDDLIGSHASDELSDDAFAEIEPPKAVTIAEAADPHRRAAAIAAGAAALQAGKVAFVLTAGGQGSRLGFEHPKGLYPIGPLSGRSLFQIMIEHAHARARQFNTRIPIYIMSNPETDEEIRDFLERNEWFGYPLEDIYVFSQGMMPVVEIGSGRVLLAEKYRLSTSPDGHGGVLRGLHRAGLLDDMQRRGIETIFYGQIDNPLLQVCHPVLVGFHLLEQSEVTTQVVRKSHPLQKVGNVVSQGGRLKIIEYSELPDTLAHLTNPDRSLKLWAGNIAVHLFDLKFLLRAVQHTESLPFHRAEKKVSHIDSAGDYVSPTENNAIKFEQFVFDLLPFAEQALVCEVEQSEGFAALKNASGAATESPEWVRQAIVDLHTGWLKNCGVKIDPGVVVEIDPSFAVDEDQLRERMQTSLEIRMSQYLTERNLRTPTARSPFHVAIMAGGAGTRFWPASRKNYPKQLLNLVGDRTMLQATVDRVRGLCAPQDLLIVSNQALVDQIREQLPELPDSAILGEPCKRDTAPCVGLAAHLSAAQAADATLTVMPADHVIRPTERFQDALRYAHQLVDEDPTRIVTFGIRPTYPAEVYGYIERDAEAAISGAMPAFQVKRFCEKPNKETAQQFLDAQGFYWNSGIFVWRAATVLDALRRYEPGIAAHLDAIGSRVGQADFDQVLHAEFSRIKGKSIDYAVLERYPNVIVVEAPFEWDDVGNWTSLERLNDQDDRENTVIGKHLGIRTANSIIVGESEHLIATIGVEDLVIVQTPTATLIAKKSDEAAVKQIVELIEQNGWQAYL
jgi:mannose-1-phosphate guanylyltransferase/mannose-6-phosphate isomerase